MTSTNELGATVLFDGECPRTITVKAREAISGGQFVVISGTGNNPVSSGTSTFVSSDFEAALVDSAFVSGVHQINGIAITDIASGAYGTIATRGAYIVKCGGSVIEGTLLEALSPNCVATVGSIAAKGIGQVLGTKHIGRALTAGLSGTNLYCVAYLNI